MTSTKTARYYLLEENKPFTGSVSSELLADQTVAYTNGQTLAQYEEERGKKYRVISDTDLEPLYYQYRDSLITAPRVISDEAWYYALGVLPPSKWRTDSGVESFHISERIFDNVVSWYAACGGKGYAFNDVSTLTAQDVATKIGRAILAASAAGEA